jgi:DNA-binding response OmpR family regulator
LTTNRILLIEDEATTRELLTHILRSEGYAMDTAATAAAAVTHLESARYSLVIADWLLPDGNGIELADRAAELGCKTIVFSSYLFRLPVGSASRHQLMMKPVRPQEMMEVVRQAIGTPKE